MSGVDRMQAGAALANATLGALRAEMLALAALMPGLHGSAAGAAGAVWQAAPKTDTDHDDRLEALFDDMPV